MARQPWWSWASSLLRFRDHAQNLGKTPLDVWDLYLSTQNILKRHIYPYPSAGFEPAIPASERPQTHALARPPGSTFKGNIKLNLLYARHDGMWTRATVLLVLNLGINWGCIVSFVVPAALPPESKPYFRRLRGRMGPRVLSGRWTQEINLLSWWEFKHDSSAYCSPHCKD
jgi:hypothetical protein